MLYVEGEEERAALRRPAPLAVDPVVEEGEYVVGADVSLIIGADWPGVGETLRAPTPGLVPDDHDDDAAATTSTTIAGSTTTTRSSATVPAQPAGRGLLRRLRYRCGS